MGSHANSLLGNINHAVQENNECEEEEDSDDYNNYSDILQIGFEEQDEYDSEEERMIEEEKEITEALKGLVVSLGESDVEDEIGEGEEEESGRGTDILDGFDSEKERGRQEEFRVDELGHNNEKEKAYDIEYEMSKVDEALNQYRLDLEALKEDSSTRNKYYKELLDRYEERARKAEKKAEEAERRVASLSERLERVERLLVEMDIEKKGMTLKDFEMGLERPCDNRSEETKQIEEESSDETKSSNWRKTVKASEGPEKPASSEGIKSIAARIKDFWRSLF